MASILPVDQETNQLKPESQPVEQTIDEYDEFRRPPILDICIKHKAATQFAVADPTVTLNKENLCPCCGQPIKLKQLPLTASVLDFSFNGPGVSLYFDFIVFSSILIASFIIVCGIYDLIISSLGDMCFKLNSYGVVDCKEGFYSKFAKSNKDNANIDIAGSVLNFLTSLVLIVLLFLYRKRINLLANQIDEKSILASDYSVIIENIPRNATETRIREFFSKINNKPFSIKKICMGYQIGEYLRVLREKQAKEKVLTQILELEKHRKPIPPKLPNKMDLTQTLNQLGTQLENYEVNFKTQFQFSGVAIISFNTEDEANAVCGFFKATRLHLIISQILNIFGRNDGRRFDGNVIVVSKAPEPGDILWENLGVTLLEQYKRKFVTNLATLIVLGFCFGILFGLSYGQFGITQSNKGEISSAALVAITVLGVIASVLISIINNALAIVIRKFAELEAPATKTEFDISAAKKLGLAQFVNTAIITLIVNLVIVEAGETSYFAVLKQGGLNQDVMLIFITNGIMPWLVNIFDPFFIYKVFQRYQVKVQGQQCNLTQQEANLIFAGPAIDLSKKYAQLGKTLMFTFFYAYLLPLGPVLSLGSLLVVYWTEKILLLRRDSKPAPTGSELAEEMVDFFGEFTILLYAIGCLSWERILNDKIFPLTWVQLAFALINFLFPLDIIFNMFWKRADISTQQCYDSECYKFWDDYDRRNPVTQDKAIEEFMKNTAAQQQSEQQVDGRGNIVPIQANVGKTFKSKNKKKKHYDD